MRHTSPKVLFVGPDESPAIPALCRTLDLDPKEKDRAMTCRADADAALGQMASVYPWTLLAFELPAAGAEETFVRPHEMVGIFMRYSTPALVIHDGSVQGKMRALDIIAKAADQIGCSNEYVSAVGLDELDRVSIRPLIHEWAHEGRRIGVPPKRLAARRPARGASAVSRRAMRRGSGRFSPR